MVTAKSGNKKKKYKKKANQPIVVGIAIITDIYAGSFLRELAL